MRFDGKITFSERWAFMTLIERALTVITFVNFVGAFAIAFWLGGDALQGMTGDGRYLVGSRGKYREVSSGTFWFSFLQILSVFVTHPLGIYAQWRGGQRAKRARKEQPKPL